MRIIEKIDGFIGDIENRKEIRESIEIMNELGTKVGGKEYDDFFKEMKKKWKINNYKDLPKDQQKKFFDDMDKQWTAKVMKDKNLKKKYRKGDDYRPGIDY